MIIERYTDTDYSELIQIWEKSVRSTHHFLTEKDIVFFKPLIKEQYFPAVQLYVIRNEINRIVAFMGLSDTLIEMLFVHPDEQGKGYGKCFIEFAVNKQHIRKVDVNEQNEKAYLFYIKRGFQVTSRDEVDSTGKPFPILHMEINSKIESANRKETGKEAETNTTKTHMFETEHLTLRPFRESDAEAFFTCCRNPNLGNNAGWAPHKTIEESHEILQSVFINQENIWAITLKNTRQLIGSIGIIPDPKRENPQVRMLGYWLDEAHWGKGYMTEAIQTVLNYGFNVLQLSLITANCYPHNKRSQNVLRRNGFIYEGILHQAELTYNGNIYDHECYYLPNIKQSTLENYNDKLKV